ncbi:hypothetical protein CK623_03000 [Vandammella animalimorsus]|uniref:Uncharacterized protein n=1 Tax=Vandammella animalimorsus TaxID=2029117 RepID=A0A2A2ATY7_9BURK|nr:hypothetical protein [Vandammella animalimorsus]PAT41223.1 hypothetical protein CK623_03000 [Vandammella animalimorsus]
MPSVQRYLSGHNNAARSAALTASSVRASQAIERVRAQRTGGGRVRLSGAYSGHAAAQVEIELRAAGGVPRASQPQFAGVGNGQLSVLGVDAAAPLQALTLTLVDLGVPTEHAQLALREVQIRARAPGAAGNQIRITVQPQLQRAGTDWALLADWPAGSALQQGAQWDWGGLPLSAQGQLDERSGRIQIGHDPQVYRPYRVYKDGAWQFGLTPAPERPLPAGAPVWRVSGGYVVTVTDGQAVETYGDTAAGQPALVTLYELLSALAGSALVEVAGVVAAERALGGQAALDVPLRTQAWLHGLSGKVDLKDVSVPPAAPTQQLTVRCINADVIGQERWSVQGAVSGALPVAVTGQRYQSAAADFLIPAIAPAAQGSGEVGFVYTPTGRSDDEGLPSVCLRPLRLGANARPLTVTFRYSKRPPAECSCSDMAALRLSLSCLGLEREDDMALDAAHQQRLQLLYQWRRDFVASNTAKYFAVRKDMDFADLVTRHFAEALAEIYEVAAAAAEWDAALVDMRADLQGLESLQWTDFEGGNIHAQDQILQVGSGGAATGSLVQVAKPGELLQGSSSGQAYLHQYLSTTIEDLARKYAARMDYCRTLAGIVPKSESSSTDAGSCWTDHGGTHWWVDTEGNYLPAFTNHAYISAKRDAEGKVYSTKEFGFGLLVACAERLKEGDQITVRIHSVDGHRPYQVGDEAVISTVAAGPAWLAGGVDGTDALTWRVAGSASGALPDYIVPTDGAAAPVYYQAGGRLQMALGGIPFALGDTFSLAIEAGQWRWRRDAGAWSALADIPASGQAPLADGLQVHFDSGAAPSFADGDAYVFAVHQPWAVGHVRDAHESAWGWAGAAATLEIDLGAPTPVAALALARYHLPAGAQVHVAIDGGAPQLLDTSGPVAVLLLPAPVQAARLVISISGAEGGHIGWVWAGVPLATDHHASQCQRVRRWAVGRGSGINPASLYAGAGDGWRLAWSPGDAAASRLLQADLQRLLPLLDWAQQQDEPLILVPHHRHPQDASLVRLGADALEITDQHAWQPDDAQQRLLSATLDLEPVFA